MELEETLMQWKQKAQLMRVFEPAELKYFPRSSVQPSDVDGHGVGPLSVVDENEHRELDGLVDGVHHSEEFTRFKAQLASRGLTDKAAWLSWGPSNLPAPASSAPFHDRLEYEYCTKFYEYMSERDPIWDAINEGLMEALEVVQSTGQSALTEAE